METAETRSPKEILEKGNYDRFQELSDQSLKDMAGCLFPDIEDKYEASAHLWIKIDSLTDYLICNFIAIAIERLEDRDLRLISLEWLDPAQEECFFKIEKILYDRDSEVGLETEEGELLLLAALNKMSKLNLITLIAQLNGTLVQREINAILERSDSQDVEKND